MFPSIDLQTFAQVVPVCCAEAPLEMLRLIFAERNCEQVVVVNSQYQPLGLISLHRLLPYLLYPLNLSAHETFSEAIATNPHKISVALDWEQPLSEVTHRLMTSLILVPAHFNLEQLGLHLHQQTHHLTEPFPPLALVNDQGKFIGLINSVQVLHYLTQQSPTFSTLHQLKSASVSCQPPVPKLKETLASAGLIDFLNELPIPLMLQTDNQTLVHQNSAWQSLVGTSPQVLQQVAESVTRWSLPAPSSLAVPNSCSSVESGAVPLRHGGSSRLTQRLETSLEGDNSELQMPSWCQLGSQPDTYICVYPMPNNQERVWQFTRQRLNPEAQPSNLYPAASSVKTHFDANSGAIPSSEFNLHALLEGKTDVLGSSSDYYSELATRSVWLVLAQDITEQHRLAQELTAKNADLIQLNRLKDEFLACISHELKTPLTAVLGLSSLLKDQMLGQLNDRQARYAELIHKSGRHLMLVVNDILDLTRIETGQLELSPEPVQIRAVCERAFEIALQQHQEQDKSGNQPKTDPPTPTKPRFKLEIEAGLDSFVADELRLRQMLVNLLCNALKFTPNRSAFGLKVSYWENWIAFTVWDKGIGIPEDKQHLIFQKFQQLESPLTRKFEGTGLGLVLTQRLARLHGGDVSFISKLEKGSQFTLLLPPRPPSLNWESNENASNQHPEIYPPVSSAPSSQSRLVLVVEAVPQFIQTLSNQLIHLGYRVVIARSGTEAVEKARRLQPKVILLNPLLPLLSGWDVLTLLKTDSQTHQIPVVVTATLADKQRAIVNRCDGFLSLPIHSLDLEQVLAGLIPEPSVTPPEPLMILWLSLNEGSPTLSQESEHFVYSTSEYLEEGLIPHSIYRSALFLPHFSHCRILEADDLNQAMMISQIWHPNVIVLERHASVENPLNFLNQLSEHESLAGLPIVTLDSVTTQVANQIKNLSIFPCLTNVSEENQTTQDAFMQTGTALLEVIQIATRLSWKPNILVIDSSILPQQKQGNKSKLRLGIEENASSPSSIHFPPQPKISNSRKNCTVKPQNSEPNHDVNSKIDQALVQYIEIAGFRSIMGQSWPEVLQQIQCKSIDLILICLRENAYQNLIYSLNSIEKMVTKIPIIVLPHSQLKLATKPEKNQKNYKEMATEGEDFTSSEIQDDLQTLNSSLRLKVLPNQTSGEELLEQIKILLTQVKS